MLTYLVAGQRAAGVVRFLRDTLGLSVTVVLTPRSDVTEFPLQNFYRFNSWVQSSSAGGGVLFSSLPRQHTLTVRLDTPEPWNVQSARAVQVGSLQHNSLTPAPLSLLLADGT